MATTAHGGSHAVPSSRCAGAGNGSAKRGQLTSGTSTLSPGFSLPGGAVGASKLASACVAVLLSPSCPAARTHHRCCTRLCCRRAAVYVDDQQQGSQASTRVEML